MITGEVQVQRCVVDGGKWKERSGAVRDEVVEGRGMAVMIESIALSMIHDDS